MIRKILAVVFFLLVVPAFAGIDGALAAQEKWGTLMYVHAKTNIRAKRSLDSGLKGQLQAGQAVKADFLKDDWYAVFKPAETRRSERYALGYVYAPRLFPTREPQAAAAKPSLPTPTDGDTVSVEVKSIRFKVGTDGKESILVEFDRFYMPAVYYLEGKAPRIVMDITNTHSMQKEWLDMQVRGELIKRVRATVPVGNMLRIAIDMDPARNYKANPILYRNENTYAVEVAAVEPPQAAPEKAPAPASATPAAVPAEPKK